MRTRKTEPAPPRAPLYGLAENVRSLWNVGSLFRTSDAVGVRKLFLCGYTGKPPRAEISKTALGAEEVVDWEHVRDPVKAVLLLKDLGVSVVALETGPGAVPYDEVPYRFPLCLLVGNEVEGLTRRLLAAADATVFIPMHGAKLSLNVAVAYGVAMYEIRKRLR
ncbi:MAG: RNA methyltransferase [Planctomycetes bacterium]|jgi:tRNA G18 (ribose-2'-O)-methylase SpoU|nr:RNA methyltransferase [Planctomycetota bacterium]